MRTPAAVLLGAIALAACTSVSAPVARISPSPVPSPAPSQSPGWTRLDDAAAGFAIDVPPGWEAVRRDDPGRDAQLAQVTASNSQVGAFMSATLNSAAQPAALAVLADPTSAADSYVANVTVLRADAKAAGSAPSLRQLMQEKVAALASETSVAGSLVTLPASQAARVDYTTRLAGGRTADVTLFLVPGNHAGTAAVYEVVESRLSGASTTTFDLVPPTFRLE